MLKSIKKWFFSLISSLFKGKKRINTVYPVSNKKEFNKGGLSDMGEAPQKIWKKGYAPLRNVVLWGWDENNNPSFLILYGRHQFRDIKEASYNMLQDAVRYTSYTVFKGKQGHLPSFKAVKIIEESGYGTKRNKVPAMYLKKGISYSWSWRVDNKYMIKEFRNLEPENQVIFPYSISPSYAEYTEKIETQNINFKAFKLAKDPNEVLKLFGKSTRYSELITDIMSHPNIYIRKKRLTELLIMDPPKEVYILLLDMGSTEVISGLFLELAKTKKSILIKEAKDLLEAEMKWAEDNYIKGVKRCIKIYLNTLDESLKANRTRWIRKYLSRMDLHLTSIDGKDIPPDKILEGSAYRKYANSGLLRDYYWRYDRNISRSVKSEIPRRYEVGPYSDGVRLNLVDFKNTIQEAEIYELADVIGKIAYYLDAPRLTYNLKGSGRIKALKYLNRYIIRIINSYAENNPEKFMEAMRHLLTSYTEYDYDCKFKGNFQFNEILKYYLYQDFNEKPPVGWENWSQRHNWMACDQLMEQEGRYEFMKDIWDNHLEEVADIATKAQIKQVIKPCYYMLKHSLKAQEYIENIRYQQLINLTLVDYEPLAEMFKDILKNKLQQLNTFDAELMIYLIGSCDKGICDQAMEFFKRTNGLFSASDIADLLFLDNLQQWVELLKQNLISFEGYQYVEFIRQIIIRASKFMKLNINLDENVREVLSISTNKIPQVMKADKIKLIAELIATTLNGPKLLTWIATFIEEVIFSVPYEELKSLLSEIVIQSVTKVVSSRVKRIISVLESMKNRNLPTDSQIIDILEHGSSKMIKTLFSIILENSKELNNRFATLLIMFESEVTVLNKKAEEVFESMPPEKQKPLHLMIIDSPVSKAYSFGLKKLDLIYGDIIPKEFIIQMLEHSSTEVKVYISDKTNKILNNFGNGNQEIFMYYLKTLLLLPNKVSKSKDRVYAVIPKFAHKYKQKLEEIEGLLLDIGGSNIIIDSERALVALAKIRGEVMLK
ncbi:MAG: hypothetical protein H7Y18_07750 [Clostridiaceae bacterium]|nr:hypothetical protein [Clostridiaceae bacterium]